MAGHDAMEWKSREEYETRMVVGVKDEGREERG